MVMKITRDLGQEIKPFSGNSARKGLLEANALFFPNVYLSATQ